MPVYNGEKYLREAVESILGQTFTDFEFIIVDDGSTDTTPTILEEYASKDHRITILTNEHNSGICVTLNRGLDAAQGEYIARMDADDISLPTRLEKQIAFMDKHLEVGALGTSLEVFAEGFAPYQFPMQTNPRQCRADMLFNTCMAHPSVVIRKCVLTEHGLNYDDHFRGVEDYHLWWRISQRADVCNLAEPLLRYRKHPQQITANRGDAFQLLNHEFLEIRLQDLEVTISPEEQNAILDYCLNQNYSIGSWYRLVKALSSLLRQHPSKEIRLVASKAISYRIDLTPEVKDRWRYDAIAFCKGAMSFTWFTKRIAHKILRR